MSGVEEEMWVLNTDDLILAMTKMQIGPQIEIL